MISSSRAGGPSLSRSTRECISGATDQFLGKKPAFFRDHSIAWSKDLGRSLDYLETRRDFDTSKMAYLGFSLGGAEAPVLLAIEKRFKAAVLLSAGFQLRHDLPEVNGINFDPHVTTPTLVLNGRYDNNFPVEFSSVHCFSS